MILRSIPIHTNFNPRTYVRYDGLNLVQAFNGINYFNPRTYVRCDDLTVTQIQKLHDFNPRTYVRCDEVSINTVKSSEIKSQTPNERSD